MKYRFDNNVLRLVKYQLKTISSIGIPYEFAIINDDEKNNLISEFPNATITEIDNTGYEWLDGKTFTNEQIQSGEVELAIEMGEEKYNTYLLDTDPTAQMLDRDYRISLLELGIGGDMI